MESWNRGILTNLELRTAFGRRVYILFFVLLVLLPVTVLFPFVFAFTSGLKNSTEIYKGGINIFPINAQWANYQTVWVKFTFVKLFINSFILVAGGLFFQLPVPLFAPYTFAP